MENSDFIITCYWVQKKTAVLWTDGENFRVLRDGEVIKTPKWKPILGTRGGKMYLIREVEIK